MITQQELNALAQLLQRTPVSNAEAMWLQMLLARLQGEIMQKQQEEEEND